MKRLIAALVVALVILASRKAAADPKLGPAIRLTVPTTVSDGAGHSLDLPPGMFLPEPTWERLDAEIRRLQDRETRLGAENESFRASAAAPSRGWVWALVGVAAGAAAGYAAARL